MSMRSLSRVRAAAGHNPRVVDGMVALLIGLICAIPMVEPADGRGDPSGVAAFACLVALLVPLVRRRRAPVLVFWTIFGLAWATDLVGVELPALLIVPLVAVHAVARYRPLRYLWPAVAAIELTVLSTRLTDQTRWEVIAGVSTALAATVLLGINARTRRAYLSELEERARRLARERDQQAELATAAERARIARELHDIVAHNLAVMIALADGAAYNATVAPDRAADAMAKVSGTGRQALAEMRRLLGLLREDAAAPAKEPQPGLDDVDALVDQVRAAGLKVVLTREGVPGAWSAGAGLAVYRILQEALTNTLKHAGPDAVAHVHLRYTSGGVKLEITDDGRRPVAVPAGNGAGGNGHGLAGMTERAASYGGTLTAGPRPDGGWRVHTTMSFDEVAS
jgi:signal transduction histidine kinase